LRNPAPSRTNVAGRAGGVKAEIDNTPTRGRRWLVDIHELVIEMKLLERRLSFTRPNLLVLLGEIEDLWS
jgi:hypothetical protein